MAQQDQGIMALSGSPTGAAPEPQINMREFRKQAIPVAKDAVREVAPEAYGEMQAMLSSEIAAEMADMSLQEISQLADIVDYINENPEEYAQIRASLISAGTIDEGDFPPEMDVDFFATMQVVLEEALAEKEQEAATMAQGPTAMMPPQGFAKGGIAEAAQIVASRGRHGDTMLAHITPSEARLLKARGGSGTINPETGLPEFFSLKKAFKKVTKATGLSKVVKGVTKVVKKVAASPIGRIALTVGLTAIGVPAPLAAGLVTKAAGGTWKDALKAAAVSYIASPTGPIGSYVTKATPFLSGINPSVAAGLRAGMTATTAGLLTGSSLKQALTSGVTAGLAYGVQTAMKGSPAPVENRTTQDGMAVRDSGAGLAPEAAPGTPAPGADIGTGTDISRTFNPNDAAIGNAPTTLSAAEFQTDPNLVMPEPITPSAGVQLASADANAGADVLLNPPNVVTNAPAANVVTNATAANPNPFASAGDTTTMTTTVDPVTGQIVSGGGTGTPTVAAPAAPSSSWDSFKNTASNAWEKTKDFMYPDDPTSSEIASEAASIKADYSAKGLTITDTEAIKAATENLTPGFVAQYGPAAAATLGIAGLAGAFEPPPDDDEPDNVDEILEPIDVPETLQTPIQNLPGVVYDSQGNIVGSKPWDPYGGTSTTPTNVPTPSALTPYAPPPSQTPYNPYTPTQGQGPFTQPADAPSSFVPTPGADQQVPSAPSTPGGTPSPIVPTDPLPPAPVPPAPVPPAPGETPVQGGVFEFQQPYTTPQPYMVQQPYQLDPRDPASLYYMQNPYGFRGNYGQRVTDTPRYYKNGGIAALAQGGYPRRIGQIAGPGTETSDDIPAMLSDGEFVMTARAVRGAGGGSRREGAKKMYSLMHQLEKNAARG
jgi:hypothetical protein